MKKHFKNFIAFFSISLVVFSSFAFDSFCADTPVAPLTYTLDSTSVNVLESLNGAQSDIFSYGMTPDFSVVGTTELINRLNSEMYQTFGFDLQDLSWYAEDMSSIPGLSATALDLAANRVSSGNYSSYRALSDAGYSFLKKKATDGIHNLKETIVGKIDSVTGKITDVFNSAFVKVNEALLTSVSNASSALTSDGSIIIPNSLDIYCGNNISSSGNTYLGYYSYICATFSSNLVFYNDANGGLCVCAPLSLFSTYYSTYYINCSADSFCMLRGSSSKVPLVAFKFRPDFTIFTYNGVQFISGLIDPCFSYIDNSNKFYFVDYLNVSVPSNDALALMWKSSSVSVGYDYNSVTSTGQSYNLDSILDRLMNKYINSASLGHIKELINSWSIDTVTDGTTVKPVVTPTDEQVAELEGAIDDAIAESDAVAGLWDDYGIADDTTADPDEPIEDDYPIPSNPTPIPSWIWPSFIPDLIPDDMFTMFRPVFDIVGTNYSSYGIWITIPSILIFMLILYIFISIF